MIIVTDRSNLHESIELSREDLRVLLEGGELTHTDPRGWAHWIRVKPSQPVDWRSGAFREGLGGREISTPFNEI